MTIRNTVFFLLFLPLPLFSSSLSHFLISNGARPEYVRKLREISFSPKIAELNLFQKEFKGKYDFVYRKDSLKRMLSFAKKYRRALLLSQKRYGVPWSVVVAILFIESRFNPDFSKKFHVVTVYYTLSLLSDKRYLQKLRKSLNRKIVKKATRKSIWARKELAVLLSGKIRNPWKLYGSWAGAIGLCQFIPSSYVKYGVDGDGDGVVDLYDPEDAVFSVANYLYKNGWAKAKDYGERYRVIFRYNRSAPYCEAVLGVSKVLEEVSS